MSSSTNACVRCRALNAPWLALALTLSSAAALLATESADAREFDPQRDLLSLHYDHAPDKDDGHSAAADRTLLVNLYGHEWIEEHVLAVSGAYGKNKPTFNPKSDEVMDAAWNDCGGWLAGHTHREGVIATLIKRWNDTLAAGGDVWVKEGGQSDITAEVIKKIKAKSPSLDIRSRVHVVQHSQWNEDKTTDDALAYTKQQTDYIKIKDANRYLNVVGGDQAFEKAALANPDHGPAWQAAFAYYNPRSRLDFSDTGELLHILGLGEVGIDAFRERFLTSN